MVYDGWPPSAVALKEALVRHHGPSLPPENSGSRFPKTTLGALKEGQRPLDHEQLATLVDLCRKHSFGMRNCALALAVQSLHLTIWRHASHEVLLAKVALPLGPGEGDVAPNEEAQGYVRQVLAEADDLKAYLPAVQRPGSVGRYRRDEGLGSSLVAFVQPPASGDAPESGLLGAVTAFRADVEKLLPGLYDFFPEHALHVTVRAIF